MYYGVACIVTGRRQTKLSRATKMSLRKLLTQTGTHSPHQPKRKAVFMASLYTHPTEDYALVYWPKEFSTSVVRCGQLTDYASMVIGTTCTVAIGRKKYSGRVAGLGKLSNRLLKTAYR